MSPRPLRNFGLLIVKSTIPYVNTLIIRTGLSGWVTRVGVGF